jgi:hypothetical protein
MRLPRRIYLDTCTLQTMYDDNLVVFDEEPYGPVLDEELAALRNIITINERARFEFVVTETGLREVVDRGKPRYTQWVNDVRDSWLARTIGSEVPPWGLRFYQPRFGMISKKDRILLQDALDLGCDAFMTMEKKLPTNAEHIERWTGLRVMRPSTFWELLRPWAALYR